MARFALMSQPIQVDIPALHRLGRRLCELSRNLAHSGSDALLGVIGEPFVAQALLDVQHDWSNKRRAITEYLSSAGSAVAAAADGYLELETDVVNAAAPAAVR